MIHLEVPRKTETEQTFTDSADASATQIVSGISPTMPSPVQKSRLPVWMLVAASLLVGGSGGAWVMHQRTNANKALVSVGQTVITRDELFNRLQAYAGIPMMHKMVEEELQLQFAKSQGVNPTNAEVDAKYAQLSAQPGFDNKLAESGLSVDDFKHNLRVSMAQQDVITQGVTVDETDIQRYYQANIDKRNPRAQFYTPETVVLRAIITPTRAESLKALQALNNSTDFAMVAQSYNRDQSRANGGLLSPIQRGRTKLSQLPALENALFSLKIGQQMGPFAVGKAWWIVRCEDKTPEKTLSYAAAHTDSMAGAKMAKGLAQNAQSIQKKFKDFETTANLQAFAPQYQAAIQKD